MAGLDWITIEGFKSIASIERLPLRPINVLIGANGSGKSNFVEAFSFLHAIRSRKHHDHVMRAGGGDRILHFGARTTPQLKLHISFEEQVYQYEIALAPDDGDHLFPSGECTYFWNKHVYEPYIEPLMGSHGHAGISRPYFKPTTPTANYVQKHLDSWRLYHFPDTGAASPLKKTGDVNDNRFLRPDGSNLAAFLYRLRETEQDRYRLIRDTVRLAAPFFEDFALEPLVLHEDKIPLEWKHRGKDAYFDASSLSDGTLRFMALATLLLQPQTLRPSAILLDEPELGLHPYAIALLASLIGQASAETQVILATQSSLLLDHFSPEDVLVAERARGATTLTRLKPEELKEWLDDYSLGQLWEKNEFGGRPSPEEAGERG